MNCPKCKTLNDAGATFCRNCGSQLTPTPGLPEGRKWAQGKSPGVAVFFSLIFLFGQFYNGDFMRGMMMWVAFWICFVALAPTCLVVWLWAAVNAYNVAARKTPLWA